MIRNEGAGVDTKTLQSVVACAGLVTDKELSDCCDVLEAAVLSDTSTNNFATSLANIESGEESTGRTIRCTARVIKTVVQVILRGLKIEQRVQLAVDEKNPRFNQQCKRLCTRYGDQSVCFERSPHSTCKSGSPTLKQGRYVTDFLLICRRYRECPRPKERSQPCSRPRPRAWPRCTSRGSTRAVADAVAVRGDAYAHALDRGRVRDGDHPPGHACVCVRVRQLAQAVEHRHSGVYVHRPSRGVDVVHDRGVGLVPLPL